MAPAAFYAIGAYTTAILLVRNPNLTFPLPLVGAAILGGLIGAVVALPSLRLSGLYLVIGTLAIHFVSLDVIATLPAVTGGMMGIFGIPPIQALGFVVERGLNFTVVAWLVAIVTVACLYKLEATPFGRVLRGAREDPMAARSLGKRVVRFQIIAFALSASASAIAGSLFAHFIGYIDPTSFDVNVIVAVLAGVLMGGSGSRLGPLIGAGIIVGLPQAITLISLPPQLVGPGQTALYGLILILTALLRPEGLVPERAAVHTRRLGLRLTASRADETDSAVLGAVRGKVR
jgi:branched-chain amino acid transport system permease protein